jgi:hypothetical protein
MSSKGHVTGDVLSIFDALWADREKRREEDHLYVFLK